MAHGNRLATLTAINLDDFVDALGCGSHPRLAFVLRRIFSGAARSFALQMLEFDSAIAERGLAAAARQTERLYVRDVRVFNSALMPSGSFLALANHPGVTDTLALMAALGRPDLKVIALDRPFLLTLPNLSKQLCFVTDRPQERFSLVRRVSKHLRDGGSVLSFPAGRNEPDPDVYPGSVDALQGWTDSAGVFLRLAPETAVVPVCVRGVIWRRAAEHPLVRLRRTHDNRQLLASALQLLSSILVGLRPVTADVQIGRPITASDLGSTDAGVIHRAVLSEMRRLIENRPEGRGQSLL